MVMIPLYRYPATIESWTKKPEIPTANLASPRRIHIDPDQTAGIDIARTTFKEKDFTWYKSWPMPCIHQSCRYAHKTA
jgi:hypothetical protein